MKNLLVFLSYSILIFAVFGKLAATFFQQDEWAIFGNLIYWEKASLSWLQRLFVYEQSTHIVPLTQLFSYLQFRVFNLDFSRWALLSLGLHLLNSFLVFYLSDLILRKKWLSFAIGLLFALNSVSHQAVTWIATSSGTVGTTLFILLTLIFFIKKYFTLSWLMLILSLGVKETSIFLFAFLPVLGLILGKRIQPLNFRKIFIVLLAIGFFYFGLRFLLLLSAPPPSAPPEAISQPAAAVYFYRFFTLPLKAISQSLIPASWVLRLSETMVILAYPHFSPQGTPNPYIVESVAGDIISYGLTALIFIFSWVIFKYLKKLKEENLCSLLIFSLSFIALGSLPFIFIPGKAGYFSIFEPRHLYVLSIGAAIFAGIITLAISQWLRKKRSRFLFVAILVLLVSFHGLKIRADLETQVKIGEVRRSILAQIYNAYPNLPPKVIFYTESDRAYYGLPPDEKILPFQSGFGQTLLIWYNNLGEEFPACFFKENFLYVLLAEDYKECQGRGFGYFRKLELLRKTVKENKLPKESIIAFSYNSNNQSLKDITLKIRDQFK